MIGARWVLLMLMPLTFPSRSMESSRGAVAQQGSHLFTAITIWARRLLLLRLLLLLLSPTILSRSTQSPCGGAG